MEELYLDEDNEVITKPVTVEEETTPEPDIAMIEILKLNAPEWHLILIGSIAAIPSGIIQPLFAILLSEIIGVSSMARNTIQ